MGKVIACCGHEVSGEEAFQGYYWKAWNGGEINLSYGNLCPKCVPIYRAIKAKDWVDAGKKLSDDDAVGLIDILEGQYGGQRTAELIAGVPFEIYAVPLKEE